MPQYFDWFPDGEKIEYERTGKCNRCGDCCNTPIHLQREDNTQIATGAMGDDTAYPIYETAWGIWPVDPTEYAPCSQLIMLEGQASCVQHHRDKSDICLVWPTSPHQIEGFPNCSYKFTIKEHWGIDGEKK